MGDQANSDDQEEVSLDEEEEEKVIELLINHLGEDISNGLSTSTTYFINRKDYQHLLPTLL